MPATITLTCCHLGVVGRTGRVSGADAAVVLGPHGHYHQGQHQHHHTASGNLAETWEKLGGQYHQIADSICGHFPLGTILGLAGPGSTPRLRSPGREGRGADLEGKPGWLKRCELRQNLQRFSRVYAQSCRTIASWDPGCLVFS